MFAENMLSYYPHFHKLLVVFVKSTPKESHLQDNAQPHVTMEGGKGERSGLKHGAPLFIFIALTSSEHLLPFKQSNL